MVGIHRDKLLSNPVILYEDNGYVEEKVDKLWRITLENLFSEYRRNGFNGDLNPLSVLNSLAKKDKMNEDVVNSIKDKEKFYLSQLR